MMQLGAKGLALIKSFEQCRLNAYLDQRGRPTIGWGHTGPEIYEGMACTRGMADNWLLSDIKVAVMAVIRSLDVVIGQNAFDALVCFTYNVGAGAEAHSTLLKLINAGRIDAAADEFLKWDHIDGVENAGLKRRREAERALFVLPDEDSSVPT